MIIQLKPIREFSVNVYLLWKSPFKSIPEGYCQWSGSRTVKSNFKSDSAKLVAI